MKNIIWLIVPAIIMISCPGPKTDPKHPEIVIKDDVNMCPAACEHAASLGCYEAKPLVFKDKCEKDNDCDLGVCIKGQCTETCVMACEGLVNEGITLGLECWKTITECRQIETVCR